MCWTIGVAGSTRSLVHDTTFAIANKMLRWFFPSSQVARHRGHVCVQFRVFRLNSNSPKVRNRQSNSNTLVVVREFQYTSIVLLGVLLYGYYSRVPNPEFWLLTSGITHGLPVHQHSSTDNL